VAVATGWHENRCSDLAKRRRGQVGVAAAGSAGGVIRAVGWRGGGAGVEVDAKVCEADIEEGAGVGAVARRDGGKAAGEGQEREGDDAARVKEARHAVA